MPELPDRLETDYYITRDDFVSMLRRMHWGNRTRVAWALANWLILPGCCALGSVLSLANGKPDWAVVYGMGGLIVFVTLPILIVGMPEWAFVSMARTCDQSGMLGEIQLTLTPKSFGTAGELGRSEWYWPKLHRVDESRRGLAVYVTPIHAVLLPRTGFDPPEEYDAVRAFVLDRFARTRPTSESPA